MGLKNLNESDLDLIDEAKKLIKKRKTSRSRVVAALRTKSGNKYFGVCVVVPKSEPCSMCAEYSAVGAMCTAENTTIDTIVAVFLSDSNKYEIFPPCGKCRQLLSSFGDPYIILKIKNKFKKTKLGEIMLFQY